MLSGHEAVAIAAAHDSSPFGVSEGANITVYCCTIMCEKILRIYLLCSEDENGAF